MDKTTSIYSFPRGKHRAIVAALRDRIVAGKLAPGARLATRRELGREFGVSSMTVQQALDHLRRDGFVVSQGMRGTFVSQRPPHLRRYGIIFLSDPNGGDQGYWPPAWHAMHQEAMRLSRAADIEIKPYFNITGHADVEDYQTLLADIREQRLAGLMFAQSHHHVLASALEGSSLPQIGLFMKPGYGGPHVIYEDSYQYIEMAVDHLVAKGRRRIAVVDVPGSGNGAIVESIFAARGLEVRPYWLQEINHYTAHTARQTTHLLMHGPAEQRPDGLVIGNPFLVESVTAGLVDAGLRVPVDADVVAACNIPWPTPANVPVNWLGVDIPAALRTAVDLIDRLRRGQDAPAVVQMVSRFVENDQFQSFATVARPRQVSV